MKEYALTWMSEPMNNKGTTNSLKGHIKFENPIENIAHVLSSFVV